MDWGRLFFSAYGRIRRQEFWIAFLVLMGVSLLLGWIIPIWPIVLYCSICTRTKRLHDMGRTGWLQIIPAIAYTTAAFMSIYFLVGALVAGRAMGGFDDGFAAIGMVFSIFTVIVTWCVAFLIDLAFLLWIGISEGERGDNRFGPEPMTVGETYPARV